MRTFITTFLFFLTSTLCGQVNDKDAFFSGNYEKYLIRKHKIRQVTVETHISGGKPSLTHFYFNHLGFLTRQTAFNNSAKKINEYIFTYNKRGDLIERKDIEIELGKTYTATFIKIYSGSRIVQETSSDLPYVTTYAYNTKGQKTRSITALGVDTAATAKRIFLYTYDANGRLKTIQDTYKSADTASPVNYGTTEYIYDAGGNIISIIREGKANYEMSYDKDKLLKSKIIKMPEDLGGIEIADKYSYIFSSNTAVK